VPCHGELRARRSSGSAAVGNRVASWRREDERKLDKPASTKGRQRFFEWTITAHCRRRRRQRGCCGEALCC
jgi:hypothetical protein